MAMIRPCADLRNNYNEISKICHETKQPVYITKNGYNDLVLLSNEAFEQYEDERIEQLISKHFNKKYPDFESFKKDVYEKIDIAIEEIKNGEYISMGKAIAEMEAEYGFDKNI